MMGVLGCVHVYEGHVQVCDRCAGARAVVCQCDRFAGARAGV